MCKSPKSQIIDDSSDLLGFIQGRTFNSQDIKIFIYIIQTLTSCYF